MMHCLCSVLLVACSDSDNNKNIAAVLHDANGNSVQLSQLKGKWVIVNYWASWCEACIKEIPELNKFNETHEQDVVIYGVDFDQPALDDLKQAIEKAGITFPVLTQDPSVVWNLGDVSVLPTTFIIDPQGKVVRKILGSSTQTTLMKALRDAKFVSVK
jgi:peroxiredoxin